MRVTYAPAKRAATLLSRRLDLADAERVFEGNFTTVRDTRRDYGEERNITAGYLDVRCAVVTWTPRDGSRRIISMRHAHADEEYRYLGRLR
jgi:uncharacterized DUF497 family protein